MKFTTTGNKTHRRGVGQVPMPWIEYPDKNHIDSVYQYFDDHIRIWDWDECGNETHDFLFEDGKAFRLEYSWWTDMWAGEDESRMKTEVYVEEISAEEANVPDKKLGGRDWI